MDVQLRGWGKLRKGFDTDYGGIVGSPLSQFILQDGQNMSELCTLQC